MPGLYTIEEYPSSRVATFDVGKIGRSKHHIIGLVEVDVTLAKEKITERIKAGHEVGFTAWLIKCIGMTVASEKYVHAVNCSRRRQIIFDDVDISIPVEKVVMGKKVPLALLLKKVDGKKIEEIQREIQVNKKKDIESEKDYVLGDNEYRSLNNLFFRMPQFLRMLVWKMLLGNPFTRKRTMGTVMITSIGTAGNISGWIIPKSIHNLCFGIGSINKKPWVADGEIKIRDIMHMTVLFDHDVVDGSPAARFTAKLIKNLQTARWAWEA
jgi:hypothetical protein